MAGTGCGCCAGRVAAFSYVLSTGAQGSSLVGCSGGDAGLCSALGWEGGGDMLLLAEAVLCGWYTGYIGLGASLLTHPCRLQLFVSALPLLGCLMQWIAYSLVVFKNAAASLVPP